MSLVPQGPVVHLGWVLLAQGFPRAGLATQGMEAYQQLLLPGYTVSVDEGEGFVEDLTFLAQQVHRHVLPWSLPWTTVLALLCFLHISVAITLLSRQCTSDPLSLLQAATGLLLVQAFRALWGCHGPRLCRMWTPLRLLHLQGRCCRGPGFWSRRG